MPAEQACRRRCAIRPTSIDSRDHRPLVLRGELDLASAPDIRGAISGALEGEASVIVLDLAGVSFIDSLTVGMLVGCQQQASRVGKELRLRNPSPVVDRTLAATRLYGVVPLVEDDP